MPRNGTPARMRSMRVCAHVHFVERAEHLAEMAYAGEDDLRGTGEASRIAHDFVFRADFIQRVLHGAEIAGAVVEDGDHNKPLVEGS